MQKIHLKSPINWINDPNGFIYYKGKYHLFYQHFPYEPRWCTMHWGHAVSDDLTNWEHKDIALLPSKYDDKNGCFSGSAIEHDGKMYIYYTGVRCVNEVSDDMMEFSDPFVSAQLMLVSEDGEKFNNDSKKTIIPPIKNSEIGSEMNTRDPKVWRGDNAWYIVLGSTSDNNGKLLFYKSTDLENWEYVNSATQKNLGWMWECPDFFKVEEHHILIMSPMGISDMNYENQTVCMLVDFDETNCSMTIPEKHQMLDYGADLYAPQSTTDAQGRRILTAWARMPEPTDENRIGMFCIPRVVEVEKNHICFRVHPNIKNMFTRKINHISEACDDGYRITLHMENGGYINIGGYLVKCENSKIYADRSQVFRGHHEIQTTFETPEIEGSINLDIYIDKNFIEIYINDGEYVLSNVVYDLSEHIDANAEFSIYTICNQEND